MKHRVTSSHSPIFCLRSVFARGVPPPGSCRDGAEGCSAWQRGVWCGFQCGAYAQVRLQAEIYFQLSMNWWDSQETHPQEILWMVKIRGLSSYASRIFISNPAAMRGNLLNVYHNQSDSLTPPAPPPKLVLLNSHPLVNSLLPHISYRLEIVRTNTCFLQDSWS